MTTAQLSMIAPPPSVEAVLGALTEETRIGQVDFSTRLAPEPDPEPVELVAFDVADLDSADEQPETDLTPDEDEDEDETDDDVTAEVVTLVSVPALAEEETVAPTDTETMEIVVDDVVVPTPLAHRIHEPAPLESFEEPVLRADPAERPPTVEEIARLVIERMHDAELAMMRHLDAIEVESARRSELLTAQAELDAELIRLNARREAHSIMTAARVRAGERATIGAEERRLDELTESLSRFAEVVDELRPAGARSTAWGRTP